VDYLYTGGWSGTLKRLFSCTSICARQLACNLDRLVYAGAFTGTFANRPSGSNGQTSGVIGPVRMMYER
jgi:hypothetical protein